MNPHANVLNTSDQKNTMIKDQLIFSLKNPVIANHMVQNRFILPGLAYIDIVLQFFRKYGHSFDVLQVKNLTIHNPLIVEADDKLVVSFSCTEILSGKWKVRIEADERKTSTSSSDSLLYATAEVIQQGEFNTQEALDIDFLKKSAKNTYSINEVYDVYRTWDLIHNGFMRGEGNVYEVENGLLYEGVLGKEAAEIANHFMVHPVLIDASAIATRRLFKSVIDHDESLFLPLYYESFRTAALINQRCYAFVPNSSISRNRDLISLSIHFFGMDGKKIAELTNLTTKMVRGKLGNPNSGHTMSTQISVDGGKTKSTEERIILFLKQLIADKLKISQDSIDIHAGFYDLGLASANLLQLVEAIGSKINIDLPPTLLFEFPNIAVLTDHLLNQFAELFQAETENPHKKQTVFNGENILPGTTRHAHVTMEKLTTGKQDEKEAFASRDIAVIGVSGRYPKARNLNEFWENLRSGKDCITEIPASRWDKSAYEGIQSPSGKMISRWGGFIDEVDRFDPLFFRISAREAEVMDPQERLFLEICWHAMEDAGYTPDSLAADPSEKRKVGVFAGVMHKDYTLIGNDSLSQGNLIPLSINNAAIANRVSYCCNFHGPSMVVDTACSSSLVAVHLAAQSILAGESDVALAGGVNLSLHPGKYLSYGLVDMHSSDGYCKTFGKGGDGYVSAEGVGAILLKPLKKAIDDNDHIYAVIKGTSINHVGSVSGMTVPSPVAQSEMIKDCLEKTGINPRTLSYIEAHGTGTSLGDPIEIQGLVKAFSSYTEEKQFCAIGSVKSNIGHAEAAAGISGLTKLLLQFKHKTLVPSLHAGEPNPYIDLENSPFIIQRSTTPWKRPQILEKGKPVNYPRRAAISSFGASGTNAHIILEEYADNEESPFSGKFATGEQSYIVPLSARNKSILKTSAGNLLHYLNELKHESTSLSADAFTGTPEKKLLDLAYTLQVGRVAMDERVIFITTDLETLTTQLQAYLDGQETLHCFAGNIKQTANELSKLKERDVLQQLVKNINSNALEALATSWVKGASISWSQLYENKNYYDTQPARISLPSYPFSRERYWVSGDVNYPKVLFGADKIMESGTKENNLSETAPAPEEDNTEEFVRHIVFKLKGLFSSIVKFSSHTIDENELLEAYGIDSVMIIELNKQLAQIYGELPSTLFYEYQTLKTLAHYLEENHHQKSLSWIGKVPGSATRAEQEHKEPLVSQVQPQQHAKKLQRSDYSSRTHSYVREPIAIIGISGRYAQANTLKEYWENLKAGKDCISEIPEERWNTETFFHADREKAVSLGKSYGKWGSFIEGFSEFDPRFFNVSPKEARGMDPQIRIFIESCWHVLEDAGYTRQQLIELYQGRIGVFAGVTRSGFAFYANELIKNGQYPLNGVSAVANRVSYLLNLKGPSVPIDTMCSSSLTAIHEACESLIKGECHMAIAGGVNLLTHPAEYLILSANNFLSSDGRCRSFGAGGDGYVPGEGVGTVLLKPLSRALADNDQIHAIIRGSSINHGGKTNGYTVPNPVAQAELVRSALDNAGVNARTVSYIEAHGTGTPLGDPIEVSGLTQAFRADTADNQFCSIGSSKSNIGHLESAAGIAGLTKIVLQMKYGMLVPTLHALKINPNINFEKSPFVIQHDLAEWKRPVTEIDGVKNELPRIAGISSFGAGGSNAHIILEEYVAENFGKREARPLTINTRETSVILLSAKSEDRLRVYTQHFLRDIQQGEWKDSVLQDIAYTLQVGREAMDVRLAFEVDSINELVEQLKIFIQGAPLPEGAYAGKIKDHKETISVLADDKDMASMIGTWYRQKKYNKILSLWVKGLAVNWKQFYEDVDQDLLPRRISLTVYPFDNQKYWFEESPALENISNSQTTSMSAEITSSVIKEKQKNNEIMLWEPYWKASAGVRAIADNSNYAKKIALLCGLNENLVSLMRENAIGTEIISLPLNKNDIADRFEEAVKYLFDTTKQLIKNKQKGKTLLQVIIPEQDDRHLLAGISGFLKTSRLENPAIIGQLITIKKEHTFSQIVDYMNESSRSPEDQEIRYQEGNRFVSDWREIAAYNNAQSPWRDDEVYLITGGAGALGLLFARDIAKSTQGVTLILTGRSSDLTDEQKDEINELHKLGIAVEYRQTDVAQREDVTKLVKSILAEFGGLHGVIHGAGLIRDNYLINKEESEFLSVLSPKVQGLIHLDQATSDLSLRFFILFSSIASAYGNPGQTDYAAANAFMDDFSYYRNLQVSQGKRQGQTLSVNWPLWKNGGMHIDETTAKFMEESSGMVPLVAEAGIHAMYRALHSQCSQVMVLFGNRDKITEAIHPRPSKNEGSKEEQLSTTSIQPLKEQTLEKLKILFGEVVGVGSGEIQEDEAFEIYGIDSIIITQLNQKLAAVFEGLSKTLFYEYSNLSELTEYLVEDQAESCIKWTGFDSQQTVTNTALPDQKKISERSTEEQLQPKKTAMVPSSHELKVQAGREPIAIIGISGRYPGADSLHAFWENLKAGKDCITEIPSDRWDMTDFFEPDKEKAAETGKSYSKWGGFVNGFSNFDPSFFNISPSEALTMDPQERLFLQSCWQLFEDAGYTREKLLKQFNGRVGVFAGITKTGFELYGPELWKTEQVYPRTSFSSVANRVSYLLNLNGPSVPVDTMCSSSLTAVHEACENLYQGTCEMAVAGGVNLYLHPSSYVGLCSQFFLSTDGKCKSFGSGGDGFVPGEGVGAILLKPLSRAIADMDNIYAVVKSTNINHGGKTNGYTVPNPVAHTDLIRKALDRAGVNARDISYVEAHGTGTSLGDPIEITGLTQAFQKDTKDVQYCAIGSSKSNIGHLEAAAGIAGLTKIVLQMKHKMLVPSLHAENLNPNIDFAKTPFVVNKNLCDWNTPSVKRNGQEGEVPRIASVSSFGAGGANAHVILEEYIHDRSLDKKTVNINPIKKNAIVLSARNIERLKEYAKLLGNHIKDARYTNEDLADIAYTLQTGREQMETRLALLVNSIDELADRLATFASDGSIGEGMFFSVGKETKDDLFKYSKDEDLSDLVYAWASKGKFEKVLNFWVKGLTIDWEKISSSAEANSPKKISLPGYPFSQERFWMKGLPIKETFNYSENMLPEAQYNERILDHEKEAFELLTFEENWVEEQLPETGITSALKTVVCFLSKKANQQTLLAEVQQFNKEIRILFIADDSEEGSSASDYQLKLSDENSYKRIFSDIRENFGRVDGVLYLFPIESSQYDQNYYPLFSIIRAIDSEKLNVNKLILSGDWQNHAAADSLQRCFQESWIGLERTARVILPNTFITCAYNETSKGLVPVDVWFNRLCQELAVAGSGTVLYQNDKRHVCQIRKTALSTGTDVLKQRGTYVITGGFGGLGVLFAKHLAEFYRANIVLMGRSSLSATMEVTMKDIESFGGRIMYLQADVCNEGEVSTALNKARQSFGSISGIIHAAGLSGEDVIYNQDFVQFERVLKPKIQGTILIDNLLSKEPLDFVCYFSSSAAILGDFGACSYAVANRFQMAYAHYRNQLQAAGHRHGKTVVINWPLWRDGGMGFKAAESAKMYLKSSGQRFLEAGEGINLFNKVLGSSSAQCIVFAAIPARVQEFLDLAPAKPQKTTAAEGGDKIAISKRRPEMQGMNTKGCMEWDLKDQVSRLLKLSKHEIDIQANLVDFGFDSIGLTKFASALTRHYGIEIVPAIFFGYPTLEKLTDHLLDKFGLLMQSIYETSEKTDGASAVSTAKTKPDTATEEDMLQVRKNQPVTVNNKNSVTSPVGHEPIAIIGMSGRFPEARSVEEMWKILAEGRDVVSEISADRFDWRKYYSNESNKKGKTICKWTGLIPGIKEFEPLFFEISPKEAELMDPRQRLLLQEAWKALEDAGYGMDHIRKSKIGLYVGAEESNYAALTRDTSSITANHTAILSARLSYFLNLSGPNMAINTACSSGMVAVHQACLSLRNFECDTALAAGVSLLYTPEPYVMMSQAGMLSADGKCYAFDNRANGIVPGEAVAVVVLKRLSQAQADGDPIYATILGSGLNYDGKTNGITAPSGVSQRALLETVYDQFAVNPETIEYIVTHGTGTKLGDPVEINALYDAFKRFTNKQSYCALTSSKSNFGHTMAASGLVSLISLVQAMRYKTIPASLHCNEANDYINWKESPFYVNKKQKPWPTAQGKARIGAVSSFGMSGTNAHMVVQSYDEQNGTALGDEPVHLMVLSAKTQESLSAKLKEIVEAMEHGNISGERMTDIAYTLMAGRHHFRYRCAVVAGSKKDALHVLKQFGSKEKRPDFFHGEIASDFRGQEMVKEYCVALAGELQNCQNNIQRYQKVLCALAEFYCQGYELPFEILYRHANARRIHLPTYPFTRENYWWETVPEGLTAELTGTDMSPADEKENVNRIIVSQDLLAEILPKINGHNGNGILAKLQTNGCDGIKVETNDLSFSDTIVAENPGGNGPGAALLPEEIDDQYLYRETKKHIKKMISSAIHLSPDKMDDNVQLEQYGFDSILMVQLKNQMEDVFGTLPANLFFEYPTIEALSHYFLSELPEKMMEILSRKS